MRQNFSFFFFFLPSFPHSLDLDSFTEQDHLLKRDHSFIGTKLFPSRTPLLLVNDAVIWVANLVGSYKRRKKVLTISAVTNERVVRNQNVCNTGKHFIPPYYKHWSLISSRDSTAYITGGLSAAASTDTAYYEKHAHGPHRWLVLVTQGTFCVWFRSITSAVGAVWSHGLNITAAGAQQWHSYGTSSSSG